jgi:hypothetical protein
MLPDPIMNEAKKKLKKALTKPDGFPKNPLAYISFVFF